MPTYLIPKNLKEDDEFLLYNEADELTDNALDIVTGNYRGPALENTTPADRFTRQAPTEGSVALDIIEGRKPGASLDSKPVKSKIPSSFREVDTMIQEHLNYFIAGGIDSAGHITETVEDVYNRYVATMDALKSRLAGAALGATSPTKLLAPVTDEDKILNSDAKLEALSFISGTLRKYGEQYVKGPPEQLSHKLAYLTGYIVPDLTAASVSGQSAVGVARALGFFSETLARIAGTALYGAATGGLEKARDFAFLDILSVPFQKLSKPVKALAMSGLMAEYSSMTNNPRSPGYDPDAPLIGAIQGFVFGLMGPSGKHAWTKDVKATSQMIKNWITKQRALGKDIRPNAFVEDLMQVHNDLAIRSLNAEHRIIDPVGEVQKWVGAVSGEPTKSTGKELRKEVQDLLMSAPGTEPLSAQKAYDVASQVVGLTEDIAAANTKLYKGLVGKPEPEPEQAELVTYEVDGQTLKRTQKEIDDLVVLEGKRRARQKLEDQISSRAGKIVATGVSQNVAIVNRSRSLSALAEDLVRLTIAPEGKWLDEIKKYPEFYGRVRDLYNMQYSSTDTAGIYIDEAWGSDWI